ncbi:4-alpha-glucanotransferase [Modestobacter sp. I12A-02628]|uniref:4-alpha-glucanotransferase n=1 Tax=Goekera deserti TaxID=2497753 RepID=A0A7K3WHQ1_9ACTN|nr:4-alpha-glucanotransferase [Goekera deserti]MPQ99028.1 4-alpha-glucanotransferase [Goekera deserti]NDI47362.1 4-alpha-glucanotransferase [Goekera deserti]NEL55892.1 4-alpha-glucanotransferase [Goekera deserti]
MTVSPTTDEWGIDASWLDGSDTEHAISPETIDRLRAVIGRPPADLDERGPIVARPGDDLEVERAEVQLEDGGTRSVDGALPEDFPLGYHWLTTPDGVRRRLIVSPGRCWAPGDGRSWGWAVQLYALHGEGSWGIGDLADLGAVRALAQQQGAGFVLINPLHAVAPTAGQESSPYLPATRRFRNPLYLRVQDVPGADRVELDHAAGRALSEAELIDRDAVWALKRTQLRRVFDARDTGDRSFNDWWWDQGQPLQDWATWSVLAEQHGGDWHAWPEHLHDPHGAGVTEFARAHEDDVAFHAWLQWALDLQFRAATDGLTVIQDLPIGVAGGGADAWTWQGVLAAGVDVGAPPDAFNSQGQNWGSPPLVPWRLRAADYVPFIESIRATMTGAGGLRIDHVMGLFRLWWVPSGAGATEGAYIRYPAEDLLDIVALESHRAQAIVVGEDLGIVEDGVRERMAEHGILSYRLLYFEEETPEHWPTGSMGAVTTHDLPTIAGLWTGTDVAEQLEQGTGTEDELARGRTELMQKVTGVTADAEPAEAVAAAHRLLAEAPCTLLSVTLDDAVLAERRPNMPGTTQRPNWSIPLPVAVEDLAAHPGVQELTRLLGEAVAAPRPASRRSGKPAKATSKRKAKKAEKSAQAATSEQGSEETAAPAEDGGA